MTGRPAGIKEVAARARVSVGTVSNVLNRPDFVRPATRERVEEAMGLLGFVRNRSAGALKAGRSTAIGLVVLDIGNPFFTAVARGVEQEAAEHGFAVLLCNADASPDRQQRHLRFLEEQRVDGVLVTPVGGEFAQLDSLRARGTAVVLLDEPGQAGTCSVAVDDVDGGRQAIQHLLSAGRRRIAYVTGPPTVRQYVDRRAGLRKAVRGAGLGVRQSVREFVIPSLTGQAAYLAVPEVLAGGWPDAVFCANDVAALGVLRGLLEAGVRVPEDVALVGYDDIEFAATAAVPLTSVGQPAELLGRTAARLLLDEIVRPDTHVHEHVVFSPELVSRESTKSSEQASPASARSEPP